MPATDDARGSLDQVDPGSAWSPFEPDGQTPWTRELAAHLYRRAGFAATWHELDEAMDAGCQETVGRLLAGGPAASGFYEQAERSAAALLATGKPQSLAAWWLHVMAHSPHPLLERLTLFWHGHFATSAAKVTDARMMFRQHGILRKHALGRFGPLLDEVSKDPAMLVWLDSTTNHKVHPNEKFAREVMELFCLGRGNYTERDIQEAARAFTGWEVRRDEFRFDRPEHDEGQKNVLGQTGAWNGDDVLRILLGHPGTARFLVGKLFRALVSESAEPPAALVEPLAEGLRQHDYDLAWLVKTILGSRLFYSPHAVRQRVKGPVELAIGLLRATEASANMFALADELQNLGQAVFFPPNVKGWDGGTAWINSSTLVGRANLAWSLVGGDGRLKARPSLPRLSALAGVDQPAAQAARLVELLLAGPLPDAVRVQLAAIAAAPDEDERLRFARLAQAIATLPEFQLS
jgi:uncharacterized protein (DUF1800 family)